MKNYTDCTNYIKGLCKNNDMYCNERSHCFCKPLSESLIQKNNAKITDKELKKQWQDI